MATRLATSPSKEAKANLAFQVISKRQKKGSIILTSNTTSASGGQVFGGEALATAILDQILHRCEAISVNSPSCRLKNRLRVDGRESEAAWQLGTFVRTQLGGKVRTPTTGGAREIARTSTPRLVERVVLEREAR
ncbi:ATP-binding protein [Streptomyces sp. NPDC006510]|uniref:ATP-binding protein n=1 Tax=Streptomyces sp. NPDC006510 TaxID=3155600 RepID=UPI0033BB3757